MNFKRILNNSDAVSPVIGVILMVAITVILAAAIGSSVFGEGPATPAPQANFEIKSEGVDGGIASVTLEHQGGELISFDKEVTKVTASLNGGESVQVYAASLVNMSVGDVKKLSLYGVNKDTGENSTADAFGTSVTPAIGNTVNIKIIDLKTNQLISDRDITL